MKKHLRTLMPALLIGLLAPAAFVFAQANPPKIEGAQSDAKKAFDQLKTLAGSWEGTIGDLSTQVTIRVTSAGSAIMHDAFMASTNKITLMYLEGDRLLLTHYGGEGNRPRFEGKLTADGKSVEFTFLDVAGGTQRGLMKRMMFTMVDANNHIVEVTYVLPDGKSIEARGEFRRTK
ncbi:MAG: DUF1579 domain-containing protein [Acidobacteria bacterium]|nr:DUF1579 domain-containing protein [Acidobacteriota bacterium]